MSNSGLATSHYWTRNYSTRGGNKIKKIAIHHMAGTLNAKQCYNVWKSREASAHYAIDKNGNIGQLVDEKYRAWSLASSYWDSRAVAIECANSTGSPSWKVSDATIKSLIKLVADIAYRNNITKITYTGNFDGVLIMHCWCASTACPGPYLKKKFSYIAKESDKLLQQKRKNKNTSTSSNKSNSSKSYKVKITTDGLNIRKGPGTNYAVNGCITDRGIYTITETKGDWGKLKSGKGWICLDYTKKV